MSATKNATAKPATKPAAKPAAKCPAIAALETIEFLIANPPKRTDMQARADWRDALDAQTLIVLTTPTREQITVDMGDGIKGNISPRRALAITLYNDQYGASVTRASRIKAAKA